MLVVSRWYPAFDNPGRGIFVADQVAALAGTGMGVRVASWETAYLRGSHGGTIDGPAGARIPGPWLDAIADRSPGWAPRRWGAPGIEVTRLPATTPVGRDGSVDQLVVAQRQAEALLVFGAELAARWRIDVMHAHTGVPDGLAAIALADRLEVPLIVTEHDSTIRSKLADDEIRAAYHRLLGSRRRLLTVSDALRSRLADLLDVDERLIEVVPNVVDIDAFAGGGLIDRDPDELLWVGGRSINKGTDVLLAAFRLLHDERPELHLRLIGRAPSIEVELELQAMATELGIAAAVSFEPPTDRVGISAAMARAAVLVHPSPFETFGLVAAEALASGLPVAATPSGGVEGIVGHDGTCGVVAPGLDAPALAAAVSEVLARLPSFDPEHLRARVRTRFAPDVVASRLVGVYREEIGKVRPGTTGIVPADVAPARGSAPVGHAPAPLVGSRDPWRMPLVVGLRRSSAATRAAALPASLSAGLTIVTGASSNPEVLPAGPEWIEIDYERAFREAQAALGGVRPLGSGAGRLARVARHPLRTVRRRRLASRRDELAVEAIHAGLREAVDRYVARLGGGDGQVLLLPLDADDVALSLPLLDARVRLYPSTLRGLADEWDARASGQFASPVEADYP